MLNLFARQKTLLILRESFISLLPVVLVMNTIVLLSGVAAWMQHWGVGNLPVIDGSGISRLYYFLIPLFINLSLSNLLAKEKGLDPIGTTLIAMVCFFRGSGFLSVTPLAEVASHHGSILSSVPLTWISIQLLYRLSNLSYFQLGSYQQSINPRLSKALDLIVPGLLTVLCIEVVSRVMTFSVGANASAIAQTLPDIGTIAPLPELILYKVISLSAWAIGLHGDHSASGVFRTLYDTPIGDSMAIQLKTFHAVFMNVGGAGSTFALPFIILFSKRLAQFKPIAKLSLVFSIFNVNEILLFGLPILFNPVFFIPFFSTAFVNMAIALSAIHLGLFTIDPAPIQWMLPSFYKAYTASGGSMWAMATQLVCIVVDGCIYFPFLLIAARQYEAPLSLLKFFEHDAHDFVEGQMTHHQERVFIARQKVIAQNMTAAHKLLNQLRGGQFLLYFQPKVDAQKLEPVGFEALLRFQNSKGEVLPPTFLKVLYQQGLSKVVDQKVVGLLFAQIRAWRSHHLPIPPIAINFDKDFLLDADAVQSFLRLAKQHRVQFCIEITEHTYVAQIKDLASVARRLQAAGHRVSIDDFGAGYSSLTCLVSLQANEIKLDREMIAPPPHEAERGKVLLAASVQLCHDLGFLVVAEGIETEAQLQLVRRCGVDIIQGYYLGKPMDASKASQLFSASSLQATY